MCCRQKDLWISSFTSHSYIRIPQSAWIVSNGNLWASWFGRGIQTRGTACLRAFLSCILVWQRPEYSNELGGTATERLQNEKWKNCQKGTQAECDAILVTILSSLLFPLSLWQSHSLTQALSNSQQSPCLSFQRLGLQVWATTTSWEVKPGQDYLSSGVWNQLGSQQNKDLSIETKVRIAEEWTPKSKGFPTV